MSMLELFKVGARMVLDKTEFDKDVKEADASGKGLAENLSSYMEKAKKVIGGLFTAVAIKKVASSLWDLAKETSAFGDRIDKQSQAIGFSRKAFQEWDYILGQNGASIDSLGMSMKTLNSAIEGNSGEIAAGLSKIGLSAAQLSRLSPEERFEAVVKALQKLPPGAKKSELAMQLLGKNAQELMPLLNGSADGVEELRKRAHDLGLIMSDEDVDAAVGFGDALDDLRKAWDAIKMKFGAQLLPGLTQGLVSTANAVGRISNAVTDAFKTGDWSKVFSTIADEAKKLLHLDEITWPTWDTVKAAASTAWDLIKKGLTSVFKFAFGENEDGGIKWPTWEQVKVAVETAWTDIKAGLKTVLKFALGENEDGGIKWPTWEDVKPAFEIAWGLIKDGAAALMKLVFGTTEDGAIKWPTWDDVKSTFETAWSLIKTGASALMKLAFGSNEDGSIAWPTWADIETSFDKWWNGEGGIKDSIQKAATWVLQLFGMPEEDAEQIASDVGTWWSGVVGTIVDSCKWVLGLFGLPTDVDETKLREDVNNWFIGLANVIQDACNWVLPLFGVPEETTEEITQLVGDWFQGITNLISGACHWVLSIFGFEDDSKYTEAFKQFWGGDDGNGGMKAVLKQLANWALGALNLPSIDEIRQQIIDWWNDIVSGITLTIGAIFGGIEEDPSTVHTPDSGIEHGGGGAHFAKGLNYVPYDGYRAVLHRGETILNQNQGRQWRQGGGGFDSGALYSAVAEAVAAAVSNIQIDMDGKAVGNAVTKQVSRNIYQQQFGRRVAAI